MSKSPHSIVTSVTIVKPLAVLLVAAFACSTAFAQWQWIDSSGRKVYSDTAPPQGVPEKNILKRPRSTAPVQASSEQQIAPAGATAPAASEQKAKVDPALEAKKKQAEKQAEAQRKEEMDKILKIRSENCANAKRAKATLDSGVRIATTNAIGEREIMDDAARAKEVQRVQNVLGSDCGPLAQP